MDVSRFSPGQVIFNVRFQFIKRFVLGWHTGALSLARLLGLYLAGRFLSATTNVFRKAA